MLSDCKVTKAIVNEAGELQINLRVVSGNWTDQERLLLADAKLTGKEVSFELSGLNIPTKDESEQRIKDKRQALASNMTWYAQETGRKEEEVVNALYKRFNIKSRTELTEAQMDELIEEYKTGAIYKE